MTQWDETIQHIQNGEKVNANSIGRVTNALDRRTNFLKENVDYLLDRVGRNEITSAPCASSVSDYQVVYFDGTLFQRAKAEPNNLSANSNKPLGIAYNTRFEGSKRVCSVALSGTLSVPAASVASLVDLAAIVSGNLYYLSESTADLGRVTGTKPSLAIPIFTSIGKDAFDNELIVINVDSNLDSNHIHYREEWDVTSSTHILNFTPDDPFAALLTIDGIIQRPDTIGAGNWLVDGDPDYSITGNTVTIYDYERYQINEDLSGDPRAVIWYLSPIGNEAAVEGIIAGPNINLGSCDLSPDGTIAFGFVTLTSFFDPYIISSCNVEGEAVCKIEYLPGGGTDPNSGDPIDPFTTTVSKTTVVNSLTPGAGINLSKSTGNVVISTIPRFNTQDFKEPYVVHLNGAREFLLKDFYPVVAMDFNKGEGQSFIAKFLIPHDARTDQDLGIRVSHYPSSGIAGTIPFFCSVASVKVDDLIPETTEDYVFDLVIPSVKKDTKQFSDFFFSAGSSNSAVPVEPGGTLLINFYRDPTDVYDHPFYLDSMQLIYRKQLV